MTLFFKAVLLGSVKTSLFYRAESKNDQKA